MTETNRQIKGGKSCKFGVTDLLISWVSVVSIEYGLDFLTFDLKSFLLIISFAKSNICYSLCSGTCEHNPLCAIFIGSMVLPQKHKWIQLLRCSFFISHYSSYLHHYFVRFCNYRGYGKKTKTKAKTKTKNKKQNKDTI